MVEQIVPPRPVLLVPGRHDIKAHGPSFAKLDDDDAAAIFADLIVANSSCRDSLLDLVRCLRPPGSSSGHFSRLQKYVEAGRIYTSLLLV